MPELYLAGFFLLGASLGSLANLAVYRLAWHARSISPWSAPPEGVKNRRPRDRIPILGWLGLKREWRHHGHGFWIRPMLVELLCGLGAAVLWWWEVDQAALYPPNLPVPLLASLLVPRYALFATHMVLLWLMLVASLIDADEKTIPDLITIGGALVGLLTAIYSPTRLPIVWWVPNGQGLMGFLHAASPSPWPAGLSGWPVAESLALALGCWWFWCIALMRRTWYNRHGWRRALRLALARLVRDRFTWYLVLLGLVGSAAIVGHWTASAQFRESWCSVLSSLVGLAAGAAMIWVVRLIGGKALGREAMGFGDVTLMAMLGAFLGWQSCLVIFFLAPIAGLAVGLATWLLRHDNEIPYGPFLCLAATASVLFWAPLWCYVEQVLTTVGGMLLVILALATILMAVLLVIMRLVREALSRD